MSKDRYRVKEKTVYSGIMDGERFWEGFSLALAKRYDLSRTGKVIVGGDGPSAEGYEACTMGEFARVDRLSFR